MVCSAVSASICFGRSGRDIGQSRVPDPPERMTGTIFVLRMLPPLDLSPSRHARRAKRTKSYRVRTFSVSYPISAKCAVGFLYNPLMERTHGMIRLFKHYVPHAVLLLGLVDGVLLMAAAEIG